MTARERVLVVTVTYDSGEHLEAFLASVPTSTTADVTLVVADNGSTDGAPQAALAAHPELHLVHLPHNPGYGGAVNAATQRHGRDVDWILVANPDTVLAPGSVDALLDEVRDRSDVGAAGPAITDAGGVPYPSARRFPSLVAGTGHALFAAIWPRNPWSEAYLMARTGDEARDVDWLSGACLLLRRRAFDQVDGFDEGYFMYFEDVDLSLRLSEVGWRRRYVPSARIVHTGAHSTSLRRAAMVRAHHDSAARYVAARHPGALAAPLRGLVRLGLTVRARLVAGRSDP
ncbi:glycosyltransferase family 2 protein [Frigoribacterium salinisoli]